MNKTDFLLAYPKVVSFKNASRIHIANWIWLPKSVWLFGKSSEFLNGNGETVDVYETNWDLKQIQIFWRKRATFKVKEHMLRGPVKVPPCFIWWAGASLCSWGWPRIQLPCISLLSAKTVDMYHPSLLSIVQCHPKWVGLDGSGSETTVHGHQVFYFQQSQTYVVVFLQGP